MHAPRSAWLPRLSSLQCCSAGACSGGLPVTPPPALCGHNEDSVPEVAGLRQRYSLHFRGVCRGAWVLPVVAFTAHGATQHAVRRSSAATASVAGGTRKVSGESLPGRLRGPLGQLLQATILIIVALSLPRRSWPRIPSVQQTI